MLKTITLRAGSTPNTAAQPIPLTPVTVFVGPNNSGKSLLLRELGQYCASGELSRNAALLSDASLTGFTDVEAEVIVKLVSTPITGNTGDTVALTSHHGPRGTIVNRSGFKSSLTNPGQAGGATRQVCAWFLRDRTLMLDAVNRMILINEGPAGDLLNEGTTPIQVIFRKDDLRGQLRNKLFDAFGFHFVVDPTNFPNLRIKFSTTAPPSTAIERGWTQESVDFHRKGTEVQKFSDGVKAYTGILLAATAGDPYVMLIDEPEAFLYPPLAFKLGNNLAETMSGSQRRLMVSTHSADFVMGCIQSGLPVNIVRLTYRSGYATARVLASEKLLKLMRNPLLRSVGVLSALFYEFVVVTEADSDRSFYQEINERLSRVEGERRGIPNTLFLNAKNRQTVDQVIRPLRELGIPAVAIIDVDVVKEGGVVFRRLLEAAFVPEITQEALNTARSHIHNAFKATGKDPVTHGGISLLSGEQYAAAKDFFASLAKYGIFVVDRGALEQWVPQLGRGVQKEDWLATVFERMGEDPNGPGYVVPAADDVWQFLDTIAHWLRDPARKGIPA